MTRHPRIVVRAVAWNLFHGRDRPPEDSLFTWRSRLLRAPERGDVHVKVNRPLRSEFASVLAALSWHVALLQEVPPRWLRPLCLATGASGASALTSRNTLHVLRAAIARLNPDLIASNAGGSNQVLARPPWRIVATRRETIARRPERRRMLLVRLAEPGGRELAVANLHASTGDRADEVLAAAERAVEFAREAPLMFGGDLNLRQRRSPAAFGELERRYGLAAPTAPDAIDHLLVRGLMARAAPARLPPQSREVAGESGRAIRLSDHSLVAGTFEME